MTVQEMEKKLQGFQSDLDSAKKEYQVKMDAAQRDAVSWKETAEKFQSAAEKAEVARKEEEGKRKATEMESREKETTVFIEDMKKQGLLTPAQADISIKLMKSMTSGDEIAKFQKKDGSSITHTQLSLFKELLKGMNKKQVDYGETSHSPYSRPITPDNSSGENGQEGDQNFVEVHQYGKPNKVRMPTQGADQAAKAYEYQDEMAKRGTPVSYGDALIAISLKK